MAMIYAKHCSTLSLLIFCTPGDVVSIQVHFKVKLPKASLTSGTAPFWYSGGYISCCFLMFFIYFSAFDCCSQAHQNDNLLLYAAHLSQEAITQNVENTKATGIRNRDIFDIPGDPPHGGRSNHCAPGA